MGVDDVRKALPILATKTAMTMVPGRSCPPHYGYSPRVFARPPEIVADTLYVVGGLYGNALALDAIERMAAREDAEVKLVFNGDFHWFDADPALYAEIEQRVVNAARHSALRGNVETEIASGDDAAGCGCAYPASVPDEDVERSNAILRRLRTVACGGTPLPMHAVALVGELRIGIVHGDAWSLAGWNFAHDALHDPAQAPRLKRVFAEAMVDGFACSHTCAPALARFRERFVVNNGAAGMANFAGSTCGVLSRISARPLPPALEAQRLYGLRERDVWVDALKVEFDPGAWLARFDAIWPAGSPAALSYRPRIERGPRFTIDDALGQPITSLI